MKRSHSVSAAVLVASGLVSIGPASPAMAAGGTTCTVEHEVSLTPGLLALQGSTGTFKDQTLGTVSCDGPVKGVTPTGAGTFLDQGNYGTTDPDTCLGGEGVGSYTMVFPTADGTKTVVLPFTVTFGGPAAENGLVAVQTKGDGFTGEFGATPVTGDCVVTPVSKLAIKGYVVVSG